MNLLRRLYLRIARRHRYHDAAWVRPDLTRRTHATPWERVIRALRRREEFGYDEREARAGDAVRQILLGVLFVGWIWFFIRSVLVINIFAG